MDPEIAKAARKYFDQMAKAKAAGDKPSALEREAYARQLTNGTHGYADMEAIADQLHGDGGNAVASALQGFTQNWGDEIVGMLPQFLGGGEEGKQTMRLRGDMMRREHPVGDVVAQMAGGAASAALLPGGAAAKGASLAEKIAHGARIGAAFGAANGAGAGEDAQSRIIGGGVGFGVGAGAGAAIPAIAGSRWGQGLGAKISALASRVMPEAAPEAAAATIAPDFSRPPTPTIPTQVTSPIEQARASVNASIDATNRAHSGVRNAIHESGGVDAVRAALNAKVAAGVGDITTLADLSKPLTAALDFSANNSPVAHAAVSDMVGARTENMTQRVIDNFAAAAPETDAGGRMAQLKAARQAFANGPEGYGTPTNGQGLRGQNLTMSLDSAEPLLDQPKISGMWDGVQKTAQIGTAPAPGTPLPAEGAGAAGRFAGLNPGQSQESIQQIMRDPEILQSLKDRGINTTLLEDLAGGNSTGKQYRVNDVMALHSKLKAATEQAFRGANPDGDLGARLASARDVVKQTLVDNVPGYAAIDAKYAEHKGLERALQLGMDRFDHSADVTGMNREIANLTPAELFQYRTGLAHRQLLSLSNRGTTNGATNEMIAKNQVGRANLLRHLFGDGPTLDHFLEQAKQQLDLGRVNQTVGGSATHSRGAAAASQLADELGIAQFLKPSQLSLMSRVEHAAFKAVAGGMIKKRAGTMAPQLLKMGPDEINKFLDQFAAEHLAASSAVGKGSAHIAPTALPSLFGSRTTPTPE